VLSGFCLVGCKNEEEEPAPEGPEQLEPGAACDPDAQDYENMGGTGETGGPPPAVCSDGLSCEKVGDTGDYVCGTALEIRGRVIDALTSDPIEGALVAALDETGAPITDVVETDSCGGYALPLEVERTPEGDYATTPKWTLMVSAQDYEPFPDGLRPALPIDIQDAVPDPDFGMDGGDTGGTGGEEAEGYPADVIENAATTVALIPLEDADAGGATLRGTILSEAATGSLVVAEGVDGRIPYGVADRSGDFTLFNVPSGDAIVRAYRFGVEVEPAELTVGGEDVDGVDLKVISENPDDMADVSGTLNIVNAPGGSMTSVVLVPASLFNEALERGPVPYGLRDPEPPNDPDVTGEFSLVGVPTGVYKVLVAFENDDLVRDPDESIAGTAIQEIDVMYGDAVIVDEAFKVTEALGIDGPGADAPELVEGEVTFRWMDDSSEDRYELSVYDALGNVVWEDLMIPGASGDPIVTRAYEGESLVPGMYYQFRVTSFKDPPMGDPAAISRTEDLRGVFVTGEQAAPEECDPDEQDGGTTTGG
jgi:hypothetical protein